MNAPDAKRPRPGAGIRAVLFDMDGTLYETRPMRKRLARDLLLSCLPPWAWRSGRRRIRAIQGYRRALEQLREQGPQSDLRAAQVTIAARATGLAEDTIRVHVEEWMERRPLPYLRGCRRDHLPEVLAGLRARGLALGVFSDYPVRGKLEALDLAGTFDLELHSGLPEVPAFKPDPAGFLAACRAWNLDPAEVLYVGDRPEVDAAGAAAAGMPCAIVGPAAAGKGSRGLVAQRAPFLVLEDLRGLLEIVPATPAPGDGTV